MEGVGVGPALSSNLNSEYFTAPFGPTRVVKSA